MSTKRTTLSANLAVAVILVVGILAIVNFLSTRRFVRADLTEDKQYTISKATRNILASLNDLVTIKVFQSQKNLPPQLAPEARRVHDVLREYRAHSNGKIQISCINPDDDPKAQDEANRLGVREMQVQVMERDQYQTALIRFGLAVIYSANNKTEAIGNLSSTSNLEYDLTSAIIKVTSKELKKIAFLSGHEEKNIYDDYATVRQSLEKQYTTTSHDTSNGTPVPEDVDTLVVAGPRSLKDRDKYEIDQFIMRGGRAVFLIDSLNVPAEIPYGMPVEHNIGDLLEHYGIKLNKDMVMDPQFNLMYTFAQGAWRITTPHPGLPKILPSWTDMEGKRYDGFNRTSPITSCLEVLAFPFVSSLEVVQERGQGKEVVELVKSSPASWAETKDFNLSPEKLRTPFPSAEQKQHLLAVALSGEFTSFFTGKPVPQVEPKEGEAPPSPVEPDRKTIGKSPSTHIVVMADSDFIAESFGGLHAATIPFFLNAVDWMTLNPDLASIRARELKYRPLKETTPGERLLYKLLILIGMPLLVAIFGIVRFVLRRHAKSPYATTS